MQRGFTRIDDDDKMAECVKAPFIDLLSLFSSLSLLPESNSGVSSFAVALFCCCGQKSLNLGERTINLWMDAAVVVNLAAAVVVHAAAGFCCCRFRRRGGSCVCDDVVMAPPRALVLLTPFTMPFASLYKMLEPGTKIRAEGILLPSFLSRLASIGRCRLSHTRRPWRACPAHLR